MLSAVIRTTLLAFACFLACGQTFEAASVRPATPPTPDGRGRIFLRGPSGGPGTKDPGRINYPNMSLRALLMSAYEVKNYQITGPAWLDTERFDINATLPPDTTKEQFRVMLQNLLIERFKLAVHREKKELPMYELTVAKGGPKLKESPPPPPASAADDDAPPAPPPLPAQPKIGPDGFPELPLPVSSRGGLFMMMMPGRARFTAVRQTMHDLAERLTMQMNRPVTDVTGLTAKYDFTLTFSPEGMNGPMGPMGPPPGGVGVAVPAPPPPPAGGPTDNVFAPQGDPPPTIFGALQSQLGLKLESKKGDVEIIVVDHIEKTPTQN
jgi:uncharacterized protein (TIGR03435 family)